MVPICPLINGPRYASFFGRGGPTTICGTDLTAGVEARERIGGRGGREGEGRVVAGTDILMRGGRGGWDGAREGLGEDEEEGDLGLMRAQFFVRAIFNQIGDFGE